MINSLYFHLKYIISVISSAFNVYFFHQGISDCNYIEHMHCILFFSYFINKSNSQLVLYYYKIYMYNKTETYI